MVAQMHRNRWCVAVYRLAGDHWSPLHAVIYHPAKQQFCNRLCRRFCLYAQLLLDALLLPMPHLIEDGGKDGADAPRAEQGDLNALLHAVGGVARGGGINAINLDI